MNRLLYAILIIAGLATAAHAQIVNPGGNGSVPTTANFQINALGVGVVAPTIAGQINLGNGWLSLPTTSDAGGSSGVILGNQAGFTMLQATQPFTVDSNNTLVGYQAGFTMPANTLSFTTLFGMAAGKAIASGVGCSGFGQKAFASSTSCQTSTAVGGKAGSNVTAPVNDTFVGYGTGFASIGTPITTNIGDRVFVGYDAGFFDEGDYNIDIGFQAGPQNALNTTTTSSPNIAIGYQALSNAATGNSREVAIGYQADYNNTSASNGVSIGYQAGFSDLTGNSNVFIGHQAGYCITGNHNIFLGEFGTSGTSCPPAATSNTFIAGSTSSASASKITNVYFGNGIVAAAPVAYAINGTGGSGTDIAGAALNIAGGQSTGAGAAGPVTIQYAPATGSSATPNTLVTNAQFGSLASISGGASLSTGSNSFAGRITGLAATNNILTPGMTCANAVTCVFQDDTTLGGVKVTAQGTATETFSATASDTADYVCGCR